MLLRVTDFFAFQDCDSNMMYVNCPGGDPRPSPTTLKRLMSDASTATLLHFWLRVAICTQVVNLLNRCFDYFSFNLTTSLYEVSTLWY